MAYEEYFDFANLVCFIYRQQGIALELVLVSYTSCVHTWCFTAPSRLGLYCVVELGAAQPPWGVRALIQLGSKVSGSDQLPKEPVQARTWFECSNTTGTHSLWLKLPWLCLVLLQASKAVLQHLLTPRV